MKSKAKKFVDQFNDQQTQFQNVISFGREKVKQFLSAGNNVESLIDKKVEDYILLEEQPMPIQVGDRTIYIGNFTYENEHKFFHQWAEIIGALQAKLMNMKLAEDRRKDLLIKGGFDLIANADVMMQFLMMDDWLFKKITRLLKKTLLKQQAYLRTQAGSRVKIKWENCTFRYFKKHITMEKLIQICWLIYFYNFDSVKKNASIMLEKMNLKALSGTFMYSWLRNLSGMTGEYLRAQAPSIDYAFRDKPKTKPQENPQGKEKEKGES